MKFLIMRIEYTRRVASYIYEIERSTTFVQLLSSFVSRWPGKLVFGNFEKTYVLCSVLYIHVVKKLQCFAYKRVPRVKMRIYFLMSYIAHLFALVNIFIS
jgi:hypothetical protein